MGSNGYQSYDASTQQLLGDSTTATFAGNYKYTKGFDVVANGNSDPAQPDRDGFMSKLLYGAVDHQFNEKISGFLRGYGYDNRADYDSFYNYLNNSLQDTRQLDSQTWDTGLRF